MIKDYKRKKNIIIFIGLYIVIFVFLCFMSKTGDDTTNYYETLPSSPISWEYVYNKIPSNMIKAFFITFVLYFVLIFNLINKK